jgi:glycosyltransferase involved in cell wall biosynthesis
MAVHSNSNFTVVIPAYNASETIVRALESVLTQTVLPAEIVVVDNNSTDDTLIKLQAYENRISILECKSQGVSFERNMGVNFASSEFVAFLDADDVWHPRKIESQLELFEKSSNKNIIVGCYARYSVNGKFIGHNNYSKDDYTANSDFIEKGHLPCLTSSWLLRRSSYLELNGMDVDYDVAEDFEFICRLINNNFEFKIVRQELIDYSLNINGLTAQNHTKQYLLSRFFIEKYFCDSEFYSFEEFMRNSKDIAKYKKEAKLNYLVRIALIDRFQNKHLLSLYCILKAFFISPKYFLLKIKRQLM